MPLHLFRCLDTHTLLSEKVGARLSRFCDVWRRKGCSGWVCKALEICFQLHFRECAPRTCTPSPFVDRGPLLKRKALSALVHKTRETRRSKLPAVHLLPVFTVTCSSFQRRQEEGGLLPLTPQHTPGNAPFY